MLDACSSRSCLSIEYLAARVVLGAISIIVIVVVVAASVLPGA
jgi:hypothetical protein